jgi:hypothetical protein
MKSGISFEASNTMVFQFELLKNVVGVVVLFGGELTV